MESENNSYDLIKFRVLQDPDDSDITYKLSLGAEEFESYITLWSNDFSTICQSIEECIFNDSAKVELDFDTEPTVLTVKNKGEESSIYIEPSSFHNLLPISGLCNRKDFLRDLYSGLLYATLSSFDEIGSGWNWCNCKMVCYNMMKSRTVEEYLRTSSLTRIPNYVTKHVLIFDGKELLHVCDETIGYRIPLSESMIIKGKDGVPLATVDGSKLKSGQYESVVNGLPADFDFWTVIKDGDWMNPSLILRECKGAAEVFLKQEEKYDELGEDPYGFTSETLWHACWNMDFERIKHFLSIGADMTYFFKWLIASNKGGTTDSVGNPTFEETEESIRNRDKEKVGILEYAIDTYPDVSLTEDMLKTCMWHYCPECMRLLLKRGANPTDRLFGKYWRQFKVKYRSVLNLINLQIEEGKDRYGIYREMKDMLESANAEDVVIINDEYQQ